MERNGIEIEIELKISHKNRNGNFGENKTEMTSSGALTPREIEPC